MVRVLYLIDGETFNAFVKLNDLRNHFAHYPGAVTLSIDRVQAIYDSMRADIKKYSEFYQKMGFWRPSMNRRSPARKLFARYFWRSPKSSATCSLTLKSKTSRA